MLAVDTECWKSSHRKLHIIFWNRVSCLMWNLLIGYADGLISCRDPPVSVPTQCFGYRYMLPYPAFMWVLGMNSWQALYVLSHLPGPPAQRPLPRLFAAFSWSTASYLCIFSWRISQRLKQIRVLWSFSLGRILPRIINESITAIYIFWSQFQTFCFIWKFGTYFWKKCILGWV